MKVVATELQIDAPPSRVWDVLTDFPSHSDWNPFVRFIAGRLRPGETLSVFIQPPGGKGMRFSPTVLSVQPNRELRWKGKLLVPGLFDGEHYFRLKPANDGTQFEHGETFSGLLVALMPASSFGNIRAGFEAMNEALKIRAEG